MPKWTADLEEDWFKDIIEDFKDRGECFFEKMGWTEKKWDQPVMGKMKEDFDKMRIANDLKDAEDDCKKESDDGKDGGKFMR